jgi:hypothetical protein
MSDSGGRTEYSPDLDLQLAQTFFRTTLHKLQSPNVDIITSFKTIHTLGNTNDEISTFPQVG